MAKKKFTETPNQKQARLRLNAAWNEKHPIGSVVHKFATETFYELAIRYSSMTADVRALLEERFGIVEQIYSPSMQRDSPGELALVLRATLRSSSLEETTEGWRTKAESMKDQPWEIRYPDFRRFPIAGLLMAELKKNEDANRKFRAAIEKVSPLLNNLGGEEMIDALENAPIPDDERERIAAMLEANTPLFAEAQLYLADAQAFIASFDAQKLIVGTEIDQFMIGHLGDFMTCTPRERGGGRTHSGLSPI
jgi:hypothetical protein